MAQQPKPYQLGGAPLGAPGTGTPTPRPGGVSVYVPPQIGLGQLAAQQPIRGRPLPTDMAHPMLQESVPAMRRGHYQAALEALRSLFGGGL